MEGSREKAQQGRRGHQASGGADLAEGSRGTLVGLLLIILAAIAAYHNSFRAPFVFDDIPAINENPSIKNLWSVQVLRPPLTSGTVGRPVVNLSLALNYGLGGLAPVGYHIGNLCLHVLAALALFGVLRRTLALPSLQGVFAQRSRRVALATTLVWTVHPLLTQTVTFISQRTELMAGAFYLLTFYCVVRALTSMRRALWYSGAVLACLLGMSSKEVMATAPFMILLFDRAFVSGSFRKAWGQRWRLYVGLASTWALLGMLVLGNRDRNDTVGFGHGAAWWQYAFTQCRAIVGYLKLALWPGRLTFDYGTEVVSNFTAIWPQALLLLTLLAATIVATARRPRWGFFGCWFFGILAPSSSIIPLTTQTAGEHRMYLPLIAVVAAVTMGLLLKASERMGILALGFLVLSLGLRTVQRNADYKSVYDIWSDTVRKCPRNSRAYNELGNAADALGRYSEALSHYDEALQLKPDYARAYYNKGSTLLKTGRVAEAIAEFDAALRLSPDYVKALQGRGDALVRAKRNDEAIVTYERALQLSPGDLSAADNLGWALLGAGKIDESIARFEAVLRVAPEDGEAQGNLGAALLRKGEAEAALTHFEMAIRRLPDSAQVHYNYARALKQAGRVRDAIDEYRKVVGLKPDHAAAFYGLGNACAQIGDLGEAVAAYESALKIRPDYAEAHNNYGSVLRRQGRLKEAEEEYRLALKQRPDYPQAESNLSALLKSAEASP
jgi:tetratricopeptide (TPR) repeat protein